MTDPVTCHCTKSGLVCFFDGLTAGAPTSCKMNIYKFLKKELQDFLIKSLYIPDLLVFIQQHKPLL